ncbi:MAG: hypothetical protein Fur0022_15680 [Anaerolineales bacterium]
MSNSLRTIRYYLISGAIEGLMALTILLLIPSDPKNAWLFGFSKSRLAIAAGILLVGAVFGWLGWEFGKKEKHLAVAERWAKTAGDFSLFGPVMLVLYGAALFGAYLYLYFGFQPLTTMQGVLVRIFPVVFYAFTRLVQTIIVWVRLARLAQKDQTAVDVIRISPQKIVTLLAGTAIFIVLASVIMDVIEELTWGQKFFGFRVKFDLDQEANIPTYFATFNLLLAAILFTVIGMLKPKAKGSFARHWQGMGLIFLLLSLDEAAVLHERFIGIFQQYLKPTGFFYFGWVIIAIPLVIFVGLTYLRFFLHLPSKMKVLFVVSAVLYLGGAVGMEMIGGWFAENYGENRPMYNVITTVEEILEMVGILTLIHTLLVYLSENFGELKLRISNL